MPRKGFTLIELLVVVAIIGLLATVAVIAFSGVRSKARDAKRAGDARQIRAALESYYQEYGAFPISGGATLPNANWTTSNDSSWATLQGALSGYLKLPIDPRQDANGCPQNGQYAYSYFSQAYAGCTAGQWYVLVYRPEGAALNPGVPACDGSRLIYGGTVTIGTNMR
jgi:prepilin-type N-terminal cleavage/methylation domain-containing protein